MNNQRTFFARLLRAIQGSNDPEDVDVFKDVYSKIAESDEPDEMDKLSESERKAHGEKLLKSIRLSISQVESQGVVNHKRRRSMASAPWLRIAASVVFLLTSSAFILLTVFPEWADRLSRVEYVILPGKRGEVTLSDGTLVTLNGGSILAYNRWFLGNTRTVTLTGEAFFEVAHDVDKPFIVRTGDLSTTVLGTSFNVKSYPSLDHVKVSVATGKVKVAKEGRQLSTITANQEIIVDGSGIFTVNDQVDMKARMAWREGKLVFDNYTMREVATLISNYYKVRVIFMDSTLKDTRITGDFDSGTPLSRVLTGISHINHFKYQMDEEKVILRSESGKKQ